MAISNAFGSNTFNILVGLGGPWLIYTIFVEDVYNELEDEKITESVLVLAFVLIIFVVIVTFSGFQLFRWHAFLFFGMYATFITISVGLVYV